MCGIHGIVRLIPEAPAVDRDELAATRARLASRGPDGEGEWLSPDGLCALGFRRLAILDLSPAGDQPMATADGRYHLVFNGEIYNFRELRAGLEARGHGFRSTGDTEVLLALYAEEGAAAFARLRGMYALAVWDSVERTLCLARDPLGIKPLYYAVSDDGILRFASQVKALEAGGAVPLEVDPGAVAGFLLWGSVPEPLTIRRAVRALPAGHHLVVADGRLGEPVPHPPPPEPVAPRPLAAAVESSIAAHLVSDVPVAVFLSAGLDSTLIAALARRHLPEPPRTFTLRFAPLVGTPLDEGPLADRVARELGTRHSEATIGRAGFEEAWAGAVEAMDQPSIDGFNTYLVCRAARAAGLKVALSGLGGDELLGSYPSFRQVPRLARWTGLPARLPGAAAALRALGRGLPLVPPKAAGLLAHGGSVAGAYYLRRGLYLPHELPGLLGAELAGAGLAAHDPVAAAREALAAAGPEAAADPWIAVQELETRLYLRNQLLRDADWASMAHSIELRVPLADARLRAEVPPEALAAAGRHGKAALVRRLAPHLPAEIFARAKTGFHVPVLSWLSPDGGGRRATSGASHGAGSRALALRLLGEWGIPLREERRGSAA